MPLDISNLVNFSSNDCFVVLKPSEASSEGRDVLADLRAYCNENVGILRLVKNFDGSIQLKRSQWYQVWNFFGDGDAAHATQFVHELIKNRYPNLDETTEKNLIAYLGQDSSFIDIPRLAWLLNQLHEKNSIRTLVDLDDDAQPARCVNIHHSVQKNLSFEEQQKLYERECEEIKKFIESNGVTLGSQIGSGNFGNVYEAFIGSKKYVLKIQQKYPDDFDEQINPRIGDLAAQSIRVSGLVKPIFVVLAFKKIDGSCEYHYIPEQRAKNYIYALRMGNPGGEMLYCCSSCRARSRPNVIRCHTVQEI